MKMNSVQEFISQLAFLFVLFSSFAPVILGYGEYKLKSALNGRVNKNVISSLVYCILLYSVINTVFCILLIGIFSLWGWPASYEDLEALFLSFALYVGVFANIGSWYNERLPFIVKIRQRLGRNTVLFLCSLFILPTFHVIIRYLFMRLYFSPFHFSAVFIGAIGLAMIFVGGLLHRTGSKKLKAEIGSGRKLPNVLFITVDTLRADHLGIFGYHRNTSPFIDNLANKGVLFYNTIVPCPKTAQSYSSILTGKYPHSHGVRRLTDFFPTNNLSLAEILLEHGYRTVGITKGLSLIKGIEKGFEIMDPLTSDLISSVNILRRLRIPHVNAGKITNVAIDILEEFGNGKFFLFLRYLDPHWRYNAPPPFTNMFDPEYRGQHLFNSLDHGRITRENLIFRCPLDQREIEHAIAHYDGEIRYTDHEIGRLLKRLEELGLGENTLIIFTADHGHNLGEKNYYFNHGEILHDSALRVPLILKFNNRLPSNVKVTHQVQTIDIFPTILDILKIPLKHKIDGESLAGFFEEPEEYSFRKDAYAETDVNYFENNPHIRINGIDGKHRMIRTEKWKLIYIPSPNGQVFELYDLETDPDEQDDVSEKYPEVASDLKSRLFLWMKSASGCTSYSEADENVEMKKRLKELGYM